MVSEYLEKTAEEMGWNAQQKLMVLSEFIQQQWGLTRLLKVSLRKGSDTERQEALCHEITSNFMAQSFCEYVNQRAEHERFGYRIAVADFLLRLINAKKYKEIKTIFGVEYTKVNMFAIPHKRMREIAHENNLI